MITTFEIFEGRKHEPNLGYYVYFNYNPLKTKVFEPLSGIASIIGYYPSSSWPYKAVINDKVAWLGEGDIILWAKSEEELKKKMAQARFDL